MAYDNTNRGALFLNDKKGNDKAPDRKGSVNVNGVEYDLAGWIKTSSKGTQFLSLSVKEKSKEQPKEQPKAMNDEIPI